MAPRPRAESPDPPLQSLESFLEAPLLGPVAFGDRVGEGERQRIAVVGRGEAAPPHVVLARQQDGVRGIVAVVDRLQVGGGLVVVGQAANLQPLRVARYANKRLRFVCQQSANAAQGDCAAQRTFR